MTMGQARAKQTVRPKGPSRVPHLIGIVTEVAREKKPEPQSGPPTLDTWVSTELPPKFAAVHALFPVPFLSNKWFKLINTQVAKGAAKWKFGSTTEDFEKFEAYVAWAKGIHSEMNPAWSNLANFPVIYTPIHREFPAVFMTPKWKKMVDTQKKLKQDGKFKDVDTWKLFKSYCVWADGYAHLMQRRAEAHARGEVFFLDRPPAKPEGSGPL